MFGFSFLFVLLFLLAIWILNLQDDIRNLRTQLQRLVECLDKNGDFSFVSQLFKMPEKTFEVSKANEPETAVIEETVEVTPKKKSTAKRKAASEKAQVQRTAVKKSSRVVLSSESVNSKQKENVLFNYIQGRSPIVWLAGVAGILGAFYLVKYLVVHGILGPAMRLTLLALAGAASVAGGCLLYYKKNFADNERIAQVLIGIGVTSLYFCAYALSKLYFFAPEWVSFILMCAVTGGAILLTLKYGGEPIAMLSFFGGFLTPMLVSGISLHLPFFTGYMLVLTGAFLFMASSLRSPLLFVIALAGGYLWVFCRLFFFDFYDFNSVWFMLLVGFFAIMTINFSKRMDMREFGNLPVYSLVLCCVMAFCCLLKAKFGLLEWGICGLLLAAFVLLMCRDANRYMPLTVGLIIALICLMMFSMTNTRINMFIYAGMAFIAVFPVMILLICKFPHIPFSAYLGGLMPAFFGGAYFIFGNGWILSLYGLLGGIICLLPLVYQKFNTKPKRDCGGILVLAAMSMFTLGACSWFEADIFVLLAVIDMLILAAVSRLRLNYILEGMGVLFCWYLYLMRYAIGYGLVLLLPYCGHITFEAAALTVPNFISLWLIPLACFIGCRYIVQDKSLRLYFTILSGAVCFAGIFMLILAAKMHYMGIFVYDIQVIEYALITIFILLFSWYLVKKYAHIAAWGIALGGIRVFLTSLMLIDVFYHSNDLSYFGVLFVFGVPMLMMWFMKQIKTGWKNLFVYGLLFCSFVLVTALLNVAVFGHPQFGAFSSGGALFAYSAVWFILGVVWMVFAFYSAELVKPAFAVIYFVIAKVFLYDVAALNDFWRIVSLFALAAALLTVSHFYAKNFRVRAS